jgi:hypothetical protein
MEIDRERERQKLFPALTAAERQIERDRESERGLQRQSESFGWSVSTVSSSSTVNNKVRDRGREPLS